MSQVFLSYSRKDVEIMHRVHHALSAAGVDVWTDTNLEPGTPAWQSAIGEAIEDARIMVVLLSPDAKKSKWVAREISYAESHGLRIIPVVVRGTDQAAVPFQLNDFQHIDFRSNPDERLAELVKLVRRDLGEKTKQEVSNEKTFWKQLFDKSQGKTRLFASLTPSIYNIVSTGAGRTGLYYRYSIYRKIAGVFLYIDTGEHDNNKAIFDALFAQKATIEADFGEPLEWRRIDDKRASRIIKQIEDQGGTSMPETWPKLQDTMIDTLVRLDKAFQPWIKRL